MLTQAKCPNCGDAKFFWYWEFVGSDTPTITTTCCSCGTMQKSSIKNWQATQQSTPPNADSDQAVGAAGDEPADVGTKTEGTQG